MLAGHVFAWPADHDSKLAFIIDLLTGQMSRNENRIAWILEGVESLNEKNGKFWNLRFGFLSMSAVVQTDPENLGRHERREEFSYVGWTIRGFQS